MPRKLESAFERELNHELEELFPGCIILKNDSSLRQGIPDRILIYEDFYAFLEVKRSPNEVHQPNQDYYIDLFDSWSFGAFIFPENKDDILHELQQTFQSRRKARHA